MKNSIHNNEAMIDKRKQNNVLNFLPFQKEKEEKENKVYFDLIRSLYIAKKELAEAEKNFDLALDDDLIDYFTYKLKAAELRYQYLLKRAKEIK
jgi:hypothetical protein